MAESLHDLAPAIIPFIALLVGLFVGRLLAIKPEKGERGDVGEPGMTGPMGMAGPPGKSEPHHHRIRDIDGLAELLGVGDHQDHVHSAPGDSPRHSRKDPDPDAPGTLYRAVFTLGPRVEYGDPYFSLEDAHDEGRFSKPGPEWKTYYEYRPPSSDSSWATLYNTEGTPTW